MYTTIFELLKQKVYYFLEVDDIVPLVHTFSRDAFSLTQPSIETTSFATSTPVLRLLAKSISDSSIDDLFRQLFYAPTVTDQLRILTQRSEVDVVEIRQKADGQESLAWRVKMSCDVNLVKRDHALRGRGNVDLLGNGVKAAVRLRAKELGCGMSTIWLNLRIFKTFFQKGLLENTILEDKGFYKAALRSPEPLAAIRTFVRFRRQHGASFRVNDAFRWANKKRAEVQQKQRYGKMRRSQLIPYLERDLAKVLQMKREFPDEKLAIRLYDPMIEAIRDELTDLLELTATLLLQRICEADPNASFTEHELARKTGLTIGNVRYYMRQLEDDRVVYCSNESSLSWKVPERVDSLIKTG